MRHKSISTHFYWLFSGELVFFWQTTRYVDRHCAVIIFINKIWCSLSRFSNIFVSLSLPLLWSKLYKLFSSTQTVSVFPFYCRFSHFFFFTIKVHKEENPLKRSFWFRTINLTNTHTCARTHTRLCCYFIYLYIHIYMYCAFHKRDTAWLRLRFAFSPVFSFFS